MSDERSVRTSAHSIEVSRVVDAPATEVFRFLRDPANHAVLDTSGMVRGAAPDAAITAVGDVFVMNISNDMKGDHQDENHVIAYEPDRLLKWAPAEPGHPPAGHTWTWELTPRKDGRTNVSHTYDWSRFTHTDMLDHLPVINARQMQESLNRLAKALTPKSHA
ncbi:SRPBCC family protein [Actinomadura chibensis]|uniref:Polyketide cyclase n=1 Tax=Actinomadura chibensis TaxID=392828 RepID=A0A5D0NX95_9ACTN|nr:SRPBCC family protein [Actinomadura chibensis]TYB49107.1 hypothetical protein FXF69_08210 [Actinomadura chibensis]